MVNAANRLGLDYEKEALSLRPLSEPIIDVHTHLVGEQAVKVYKKAARRYGVGVTFSMTPLEQIEEVRRVMADSVHFIAVPQFRGGNPLHDHGKGYIERLHGFHRQGVKIAKFWSAPRIFDFLPENFCSHPLRLNSALRRETIQCAFDLGMMLMVHVGDPDTWFQARYAQSERYGTKRAQYDDLEEILSCFNVPLIAAHMGGWPEDLGFLSGLLERHPNLYLDSSATKWMVREISKHPNAVVQEFFLRWAGRLLFGTDIVTSDSHVSSSTSDSGETAPQRAFDLYASRYWALRKLYESDYRGPSPIADPDLSLIDPGRYSEFDAPDLAGKSLPQEALDELYFKAAERLFGLERR